MGGGMRGYEYEKFDKEFVCNFVFYRTALDTSSVELG